MRIILALLILCGTSYADTAILQSSDGIAISSANPLYVTCVGGSCSGGSGDISSVGDCSTGDCFDGTQGTTITFNNAGGDGTIDYDGTDFSLSHLITAPGATLSSGSTTLGTLAGTINATNATAFRIPNSTSRPATCTVGDMYMDTDATSAQRLYLCESANTWVAQAGNAAATAWDSIADPVGDNSVALAGTETTFTSTLDSAAKSVMTISNTDADLTAETTLLSLKYVDTSDVDAVFMKAIDTSAGTPRTVFQLGADGTITTGASGTGSVDIGSAGVRLSDDGDGALTLLGLGNGSDESLTINLDDTSNEATVTSSTGVTLLNLSSIAVSPTGTAASAGAIGYDSTQKLNTSYGGATAVSGSISRVIAAGTSSSTLTNSTASDQDFTTLYTFPANSIYTNKIYRVTVWIEQVSGTSSVTVRYYLKLGSTKTYLSYVNDITNGETNGAAFSFLILGQAAAGASANVATQEIGATMDSSQNNSTAQPVALATNGTLATIFGVTYSGTGSTETTKLFGYMVEELN